MAEEIKTPVVEPTTISQEPVTQEQTQAQAQLQQQAGISPAVDPNLTQVALAGNLAQAELNRMKTAGDTSAITSTQSQISDQQIQDRINREKSALSGIQTVEVAPGTFRELTAEEIAAGQTPEQKARESEQFKLLQQARDEEARFAEEQKRVIEDQLRGEIRSLEGQQKRERAASAVQLARMGALGTTLSGVDYLNSMEAAQRAEVSNLISTKRALILNMEMAFRRGDRELAMAQAQLIDNAEAKFQEQQDRRVQQRLQYAKLRELEKDELGETFTAMVQNNMSFDDLPDNYLETRYPDMDKFTAASLFEVTKESILIQNMKDLREQEEASLGIVEKITGILNKIPAGMPLQLGDDTYYGTQGTGSIEIDAQGYGRQAIVDQQTGKVKIRDIGFLGTKKDGWEIMKSDDGRLYRVNPELNQMEPVEMQKSIEEIQDIFPNGQPSPFGADRKECGNLIFDLTGIAVGNTWESKMATTDPDVGFNEGQEPPRFGDYFVQKGGGTGHVGMVIDVQQMPNGETKVLALEANYNKDGLISNNRWVNVNQITGYGRPDQLHDVLSSLGTDAPTFGKKQADLLESADPKMLAETIFSGTSGLRVDQLPTAQRIAVDKELSRLKSEARASGDTVGIMRASAGGKDVSDSFLQSLDKAFNVVGQIDDLNRSFLSDETITSPTGEKINLKEKTGPFVGIFRSRNPYDTKAQLMKAQLTAIVPNLARGIYGEVGVLTDNDVKLYSQTLPNLTSTEEVRSAVLGMTMRSVQRSIENKMRSQANAGRDVSGFVNDYFAVKETADRMLVNVDPLSSPDNQAFVEAAKSAGYTDEEIRAELLK